MTNTKRTRQTRPPGELPCANCGRVVLPSERYNKNMCIACYTNFLRHGNANYVQEKRVDRPCANCQTLVAWGDEYKREMCRRCYQKWQRHGDENHVSPQERTYDIVMGPNGCHVWTKPAATDGYIQTNASHGQRRPAHVVAYEEVYGPVPPGWTVDHTCHNEAVMRGECSPGKCFHRQCLNPDHLEAVSSGENTRRARSARQVCVRGHNITDPDNLKPSSSGRRQCRACVRINTRISRGYSEEEALAMELDYMNGKNRKPATPAA